MNDEQQPKQEPKDGYQQKPKRKKPINNGKPKKTDDGPERPIQPF